MAAEPPRSRDDEEIAAIFARLREELEARWARDDLAEGAVSYSPSREEAERFWAVSADRPFLEAPGTRGRLRGRALAWPKRTLRKLMRWYVEPPWAEQRRFNAAVLRLLDELDRRTR
jgi:hypothetical protein